MDWKSPEPGLMVSSKALDVTGNNIANANTVGYTRQRLVLSSINAAAETHRFLNTGNVSVGGGVSHHSAGPDTQFIFRQ